MSSPLSNPRLEGRVALVTGAGRGIGAATAMRFAEEGAKVVVNDLDAHNAEATASAIRDKGGEAIAAPASVTDRAAVEGMVTRAVERFGRLDILVSNAGVIRDNLIHKLSDDDWTTVIDVHLRGAFLCAQAAQKVMVAQKYGRIIVLSSTSALGNRGQANYAAAKAGLQGFAKTLAIELGRFGITVNAVAPGFIETDMTRSLAARVGADFEDLKSVAAAEVPLGRVGQPEEVANAILFFASGEASYVSGQVLYVRGGP